MIHETAMRTAGSAAEDRHEELGMRVFFATDIHGSEVCWRKFLNAGKFHKADVLIMGGDMTGKAMSPPMIRTSALWNLPA